MNASEFVAQLDKMISDGASNEDIAAAVKAQQEAARAAAAAALQAEADAHAAQIAADAADAAHAQEAAQEAAAAAQALAEQEAADAAYLARVTPVMVATIGLRNGMTQSEVIAKVRAQYPDF